MKKTAFKTIVFIIIISFLFTACKKNNENNIEEELLVPGLYTDDGEISLEHKEITMYFRQYGDWTVPENIMNTLKVKCEKEINTTLNFKYLLYYDTDNKILYRDKIKELIASGETFESFYLGGNESSNFLDDDGGELLLDISCIFPSYAPMLYQKYDQDVLEQAWYKDAEQNRKMVYVPAVAPNTNRLYLLINTENIKKHGFEEISTLKKLEEYLDAVKDSKGEITIDINKYRFTSMYFAIDIFCLMYGYERFKFKTTGSGVSTYFVRKLDEPNAKLIAFEQTDDFIEYINMINRFKEKGYIVYDDSSNYTIYSEYDAYLGYRDQVERILRLNQNIEYNIFEMYPNNKVEKAKLYSNNDSRDVIAFNKYAKNPERAMIFLEWLQLKEENYDLLMYGEEGTDYILNENGQINKSNSHYRLLWMSYGGGAFLNPEYMKTTIQQPVDFYKNMYNGMLENTYESSFEDFSINLQQYQLEISPDYRTRNSTMYNFTDKLKGENTLSNIEVMNFVIEQTELAERLGKTYQELLDEWEGK